MKSTVYVSAYTTYPPSQGERAEGLYVFQMDMETGHLEQVQAVDAGENPSFITLSPNSNLLYAANETQGGSVSAFRIDPTSGRLSLLNRRMINGDDPCYLSLMQDGKYLFAACYSSGSLTVLPVEKDGSLGDIAQLIQHNASSPSAERHEKAHVHCAVSAPGDKFVLVVDLGMDKVFVYPVDSASCLLDTTLATGLQTAPGAGPRHVTFHSNGRFLYLSNELDSTVTFCLWDGKQGSLEAVQTLSTLPDDFLGENTVADIHLTPDGNGLYVSNRGHDSLAAFRVDPVNGRMSRVGIYSCGGSVPRNFAIDPNGRFLLAANQNSGNVAVLRIEADGALTATGEEATVTAPVCVVFGKSA